MNNTELDQAINTAHRLLRTTASWSKQYARISEHLECLLKVQKGRALAKLGTPESATK